MNRRQRQAGFTLIEVLVALLILAIGLLGLAGLQANSLRNNYSAYLRSQATFHVYEIIDRMRANRQHALAEGYDRSFGATAPSGNCSSRCSEAEMKNADLAEWLALVARLPDGQGAVDVDANGIATVQVRWRDRRTGGDEDSDFLVFSASSQL